MSNARTSLSAAVLAEILSGDAQRRLAVPGVGAICGGAGYFTLSTQGGRRAKVLLRVWATANGDVLSASTLKFTRPPYSVGERDAMHRVLRLFDRAAKIESLNRSGDAVRLRFKGAEHPLTMKRRHTAHIATTKPQQPQTQQLEGELY